MTEESAPITIREQVVLRKYDGEGTEGKEPVETIIVRDQTRIVQIPTDPA